jgi:hypothetical protein
MTVDHYTYRTSWSSEDSEFVATCEEFPSLSWLDRDQDKAKGGIQRLVLAIVDDMSANGELIPAPIR